MTDHGFLSISAGLDNKRVREGVEGILGECRKMRDELVSEEELQKAKDNIAGTTMLELETSDARAEYCGFLETLKGEIESPEEVIRKVNRVTREQVRQLAREIFVNRGMNMATVGKIKDDSQFKEYFSILAK